ncbi:MAG: PEP/pyruvate-binding domain-containing protein [Fidelibacterota bacterium]
MNDLIYYYNKFKYGEDSFHYLMANKVKEILLISTFYDAFIFEQDGRLSEQIYGDYRQLNLSTAPMITSVPTGEEALRQLKTKKFDLVISMLHIGKTTAFEIAKKIKEFDPNLPVLLLLNMQSDLSLLKNYTNMLQYFDNIFLWRGDAKIFLAMVKSIEDWRNLDYDTKYGLVKVILLVEDSIPFYSTLLPLLYEEIVKQTQILIHEELNDINKRLRMRVRPKVILAHNYEKAMEIYEKYTEYIIAVISDISFDRNSRLDPDAGIRLISKVKENIYDIPTILMSSDSNNRRKAEEIGAMFLDKNSKHLLRDLRQFMLNNIGFGDFIFRDENGIEIDRARSLYEFEEKLKNIPDNSILYHSRRNHFSAWLMARGETQIAKRIRLLTVQDFKCTANMRKHLENTLHEIRKNRTKGKIVNFHPASLYETDEIIRLTEGSLGGKGRGLAFLNSLLVSMEFDKRFTDVNICLPSTQIIGTNEFDDFLRNNKINEKISDGLSDREIDEIFQAGKLSYQLVDHLRIMLQHIHYPLAVRSSGLLEDSFSQPFAGIYRTYMLPNNHPDLNTRLKQLTDAIKLVFASVFIKSARTYIENLNHQIEEEKMAVIIQQVVGSQFGDYYYPHISGVAQSHNYYPLANLKNEDGIASIVVGLGKSVIEGGKHFRFCPKYPKIEFLQNKSLLEDSQKKFYAINMLNREFDLIQGEEATIDNIDLTVAEKDGALQHAASVWDSENQRLVPGLTKEGLRIITFDNILKYDYFPLAAIITDILDIGERAFGMPVEIEFAVNLTRNRAENIMPSFYILQIRPLAVSSEDVDLSHEQFDPNDLLIYTGRSMGNGIVTGIRDIIYVDPQKFDKLETIKIKDEVEYLNDKMKQAGKEYILIGQGRWGSQDRFLGIPVRYVNISGAKVIVEMGTEGFSVDPSQGTHFFHNIIAMQTGYFTIPHDSKQDVINWKWLKHQPVVEKTEHLVHVRCSNSLTIKMDGKHGIAAVLKTAD